MPLCLAALQSQKLWHSLQKDVLGTLGVLLSFSYSLGLPVVVSAHLYPVSCDQLLTNPRVWTAAGWLWHSQLGAGIVIADHT